MAGARDREPGSKAGLERQHQCAYGLLREPSRPLRLPRPGRADTSEFLVAWDIRRVLLGSKALRARSPGSDLNTTNSPIVPSRPYSQPLFPSTQPDSASIRKAPGPGETASYHATY